MYHVQQQKWMLIVSSTHNILKISQIILYANIYTTWSEKSQESQYGISFEADYDWFEEYNWYTTLHNTVFIFLK